jgi:hypothetical protein
MSTLARLRHLKAMSKGNITHGMTGTPEHQAYLDARCRCFNPNHKEWEYYGGRGIEFRFASFEEFFKEIGMRPSPTHKLDRENVDGHYEKGNVRWVTPSVSSINTRLLRSHNTSGYRGVGRARKNQWRAYITHKGKFINIGHFSSALAAAHAYDAAAKGYHGTAAILNFPEEEV